MTTRIAVAVLAAALALPALAQAPQKVVAEKSQIRFAFRQMNVPVEGRFRKFDATVAFDPKKPEATKAEFEVDLGSIDLGNPEGETEAKRKAWLNIDAFPKAKFVASGVRATGPGKYEATGPLTIKGASLNITAPFTLVDAGGMRTVEGQFALKRLQFKIGEGPWSDTETVADEVTVRFKFVIPST
ncbi:MAG: YceI family protein, partial [Betaproteobacteria bacterium]|nr:YceI family protein [Betaproteobacteria bacterium]